MRRTIRTVVRLATAALVAAQLAAQQPLGATFGTLPSAASRGALLGAAGTLVARFDHDDYVGWGRTTSTPNRRVIHGVTFTSEDKDGSTQESYSVLVYGEDPLLPGFPATATPLLVVGPFQNPPRTLGPAQFQKTHLFATPLEVPADRDVFVGIQLGAAPL